jgi:hypothetical protein
MKLSPEVGKDSFAHSWQSSSSGGEKHALTVVKEVLALAWTEAHKLRNSAVGRLFHDSALTIRPTDYECFYAD